MRCVHRVGLKNLENTSVIRLEKGTALVAGSLGFVYQPAAVIRNLSLKIKQTESDMVSGAPAPLSSD